MPDVEASVFSLGKEEVASVGADTWESGALAEGVCCVVDDVHVAEFLGVGVEVSGIDIVLHLFVSLYHFCLLCDAVVLVFKLGGAEV